jgi:hydroxymethylpyrimidine/phosphomethylpyrimidine kinase
MNHSHQAGNAQASPASVPVVLTLGGFDPSAGAGILADLKTFAAHNCYGVAAITALTIQSTRGVTAIEPLNSTWTRQCAESLLADGRVRALKIGMLGDLSSAQTALEVLESRPELPSVLDPVWRSSTGVDLTDASAFAFLRERLLPVVSVITPNLAEAAALTGLEVENLEQMKAAAHKLMLMGARAVVVTGGHLERPADVFFDGAEVKTFAGDRIKPDNTHGTGCTFASAIAANLALGRQLQDAVMLAKAYVTEAIKKAYPVGPGRAPLNHLYRTQETPRLTDSALSEPVH